jgi:hypothetical protein
MPIWAFFSEDPAAWVVRFGDFAGIEIVKLIGITER